MAKGPERVFLSLEEFYKADSRRERSGEVDFGVMWGKTWPHYRISWVEATGEVYAFEQGPSGHVVVLGWCTPRVHVDAALEGWVDNVAAGPAWVEYQLARWNRRFPDSLPVALRG